MANVKVIMMTSGLEIVSEVIEENVTQIVMKSPAIIMQQPDPSGTKVSVGLAPFAPYTEKDNAVELNRQAIACIMEPTENLTNEYNRIYGSGIVTQKSKLIT